MTFALTIVMFLASPALAVRTPNADEVASLSSNTASAYSDRDDLKSIEAELQGRVGSKGSDWEAKLTRDQTLKLSAARLRTAASMATLLEETLVAYELIPVKPSPLGGTGIPEYPNEVMQMGDSKGMRREWRVLFAEPLEGMVKDKDGKVLRGDDFKEFLLKTNGMTGPDGTTLVWGQNFLKNPHRLPIVLRHELAHYELFADPKVEDTTWAEREATAYRRSKAFVKHMGLDPQTRTDEEALEEGGVVKYSGQASTEKSKREQRPLYERVYDRGRQFFGLKPRIEDPGYHQQDGYHMDPEAWARIRQDSNELRTRTAAQRSERAIISLAEAICDNPDATESDELRSRFRNIQAYAADRTLSASDPCVTNVSDVLYETKLQGRADYYVPAISAIAKSHRPTITKPSATLIEVQLGYMAKSICLSPFDVAFSQSVADEFKRIPHFDFEPPRRHDFSCTTMVLMRLWGLKRAGKDSFDPREIFDLAIDSTAASAPARGFNTSPNPPNQLPSTPPMTTPLPPEVQGSSPRPRDPDAPSYPPCLNDRCIRRF